MITICASCGFPITGPVHDTENIGADGRTRYVCDRCWHDPALFFLPREIEIHGSYAEVLADQWSRYRESTGRRRRAARLPKEQVRLFPEVS